MEINIKNGRLDEDGFFNIDNFVFTAFCLLESQKPCFESASLQMFFADIPKMQFNEMMQDLKKSIENISAIQSSGEVTIDKKNNSEGGEEKLGVKKNTDKNFALASNTEEEIARALSGVMIKDYWGDEVPKYYFIDYDAEASEAYAWDREDWLLYGFGYSADGDSIVINFDSKQRKKWAIVDFEGTPEEDEPDSVFFTVYRLAAAKYTENDKQWEEKYNLIYKDVEDMNSELTDLRKFKTDMEDGEIKREREEVFSQFEDLVGVEAFETLRTDCETYSVDELTEKCFALRGRNMAGKFSINEPKPPKLIVEKTSEPAAKEEPYGGVFDEYGIEVRN